MRFLTTINVIMLSTSLMLLLTLDLLSHVSQSQSELVIRYRFLSYVWYASMRGGSRPFRFRFSTVARRAHIVLRTAKSRVRVHARSHRITVRRQPVPRLTGTPRPQDETDLSFPWNAWDPFEDGNSLRKHTVSRQRIVSCTLCDSNIILSQ